MRHLKALREKSRLDEKRGNGSDEQGAVSLLGLGKGNIDSLVSCCDREEEELEECSREALGSDSRKRERSGESLHVFEQSEAVGRRSSVVSGLLDQDGTTYLSALHPIKGCIVEEENVNAVLCAISTRPL
jgi:hypothetical protein